jgi:NADH dehydrogenase
VRRNARAEEVALLREMGAQVVEGALTDSNASEFFDGIEYAVHLIGSIAPKKGESFDEIHQALTRRFCELARSAGVKKVVLITALGTAKDAPSQYHRTKWLAEEEVRKSGLAFTILRPSLLIGRTVGSRNSKLVARLLGFIQNKQFVPLVNGGANKIQPIFIGDCVEAISKCISDRHDGETIELGGSTVLSMKRFVEELGGIVGKSKPIVNLPPQAGKLLAAVMERVQEVPTLSSDQVVLSLNDNICQSNGLATVIGRDGASLNLALDTYRQNPIGTFIPK